MRHYAKVFAVAATVLLSGLGAQPERALAEPGPDANKPRFAPDRVLVKPKEGASAEAVEAINRKNGARTEKKIPRTRVSVVKLPRGLQVAEAVERYEASPEIEYAEPDFLLSVDQATNPTPNDADYPKLYNLNNTGQTGGAADADVDAPEAWGSTTGSPDAVVAVIDTGVDIGHADLKNNVWTNPDEVPANNLDDDGNGYVDDVHGWDFRNEDNSVFDADEGSHGTHVAGTIAAEGNNGVGITGVNWRAKIMPLKFIGPTTGYTSDAAQALNYAVAEGVKISNNSYGCAGCFSQTLFDAIRKADAAGHLYVAAAGNDGADNDATASYPSGYDSANVVSVAATDGTDALASFSNYGSSSVDLAAPGVGVLSTLPGNSYGYKSGTSMAAPLVAGVATLATSESPTASGAEIKKRLLDSVDKKASLSGKTATGGRLNAAGTLGIKLSQVSLNASPSTLNYGVATTLSGRLTSSGSSLAGKQVVLEQRPVGASAFSTVATLTTDVNGNFSKTGVVPAKTTDYRVRLGGEEAEGLRPSEAIRRASVKALVSQSTATTSLKLGRGRTIYGAVTPTHAGSVKLTIRRNGAVVSTRSLTLNSSRYSFTYKPPSTGTYSFVVGYAGDADHLGNTSPTKSFKVVK